MFNKFKYLIISGFLVVTILISLLIPKTNVNYNAIAYLPDSSDTKQAYEVMEKEFGENGSLYVFVDKVDSNDILVIKNKLMLDGVKTIEYEVNEDKVLYNVVLDHSDYSKEASALIKDVIKILDKDNYHYYLNGQSFLTYLFNNSLNDQIIKIILLLLPLILLILFLTSRSYIEPLLFSIVIGISVLLNMGTNALLNSVSYMTHSIAAVIQLAVCMDYSIMLLHTYQNVKETEPDSNKAMQIAWKTSFIPIVSSALTTVAGFVAIMFMRYKIGFDIGLVLAKGVIFSLITILLLLPCLILVFDKLIIKTMHKRWFIKDKKIKKVPHKYRFVIPVLTVLIIIGGFIVQNNNKFLYSDNTTTNEMPEINESNKAIKTYFGYNSQALLLIDANQDASSLISKLEQVKINDINYIKSIYGLDKKLKVDDLYELVKNYQVSRNDITLLLQMLHKEEISLRELSNLLPTLKNSMNVDEMHQFINTFVDISKDNLSLIYLFSQKDSLTIEELIMVINQEYGINDLKTLFDETDLNIMFNQLGKDKLKLSEVIDYFNLQFTTPYDANTLAMILQNNMRVEDIEKVMLLASSDKLSIKDLVAIMLSPYSEVEMKMLLSDLDPVLINNVYQTMQDNNLLTDNKTTIKFFSNFILLNYDDFLSIENKALLQGLANNMLVLENIDAKIKEIQASKQMFDQFKQLDLSNILDLLAIDTSLVTKEFIGDKYQRIIVNVNLPEESDTSFAFFSKLEAEIENNINEYYFISRTTSVMEIKDTSKNDYLFASLLSIVMIFMIILISFKSISIPAILVLLIQGAVYINMAIPALMGENIIFIGYVIVSCIQLGATIDYAILTTHRYVDNRRSLGRSDSMYKAINESKSSIITSGLILTLAGLSLAFFSSIPVIRSMGRLIGIGGAISMIMVILLLPQILYVSDKIIIKKVK